MIKRFAGIKPGIHGAVAILGGTGSAYDVMDIPVMPRISGNGEEINAIELSAILKQYKVEIATIETIDTTRFHGIKSTFNHGYSAGILHGMLSSLGILTQHVITKTWRKDFLINNKLKDSPRMAAIRMYPEQFSNISKKQNLHRAEALLIAHYGVMLWSKNI